MNSNVIAQRNNGQASQNGYGLQQYADAHQGNAIDVFDNAPQVNVLDTQTRAEIDVAIATAHRFPRNIQTAKDRLISTACMTPQIAASCTYLLPRGGKDVKGPSVRLAEMAVSCWGNIRATTSVIGVEKDPVTGTEVIVARAICHDLETNVMIQRESRRRISHKDGRRYNDDMVIMTGNAACAIAYREAVFKVIPQALINIAWHESQAVAAGADVSIDQWRQEAFVGLLRDYGVEEDRLLNALGRGDYESVTKSDLIKINQLCESINSGRASIEEVFPFIEEQEKLKKTKKKASRKTSTKSKPVAQKKAQQKKQESEEVDPGEEDHDGEELIEEPPMDPLVALAIEEMGASEEASINALKRHSVSVFGKAFQMLTTEEREQVSDAIIAGDVEL